MPGYIHEHGIGLGGRLKPPLTQGMFGFEIVASQVVRGIFMHLRLANNKIRMVLAVLLTLGLGGLGPIAPAQAANPMPRLRTCTAGTSTIADCFPDVNMAMAVSRNLSKATTDVFTVADSQMSGSLTLNSARIQDIDGVQEFTQVTDLNISGNKVEDISALASMTQLTTLNLNNNKISNISPLSGLTNLASLKASFNKIDNLAPLRSLAGNLKYLELVGNNITDMRPLGALANMETLNVSANSISDASPVSALTRMNRFEAYGNRISDPAPFANLNRISTLNLRANAISDLAAFNGFADMTDLDVLDLSDQAIIPDPILADRTTTLDVPTAFVDSSAGTYAPIVSSTPTGVTDPSGEKVTWPVRNPGNYFVDFSYTGTIPSGSYLYSGYVGQQVLPSVTVTYDTQGGSVVPRLLLGVNDVIGSRKPADPVRTGYSFKGWTTDLAGTAPYNFSDPVATDLTLYAQWQLNKTPPNPGPGGGGTLPPNPGPGGGGTLPPNPGPGGGGTLPSTPGHGGTTGGGTSAPSHDPSSGRQEQNVQLAQTGTSSAFMIVAGLVLAAMAGAFLVLRKTLASR